MTLLGFYPKIFLIIFMSLFVSACGGEYERPEPPRISLAGIALKELTLFEQTFRLRLRVQNPNSIALPIKGLDYELQINDQPFASGVSAQPVTVPAYGESLLEVDVVSNLAGIFRQIHEWQAGGAQGLHYRLSGTVALKHSMFKLPFDFNGVVAPPDQL